METPAERGLLRLFWVALMVYTLQKNANWAAVFRCAVIAGVIAVFAFLSLPAMTKSFPRGYQMRKVAFRLSQQYF